MEIEIGGGAGVEIMGMALAHAFISGLDRRDIAARSPARERPGRSGGRALPLLLSRSSMTRSLLMLLQPKSCHPRARRSLDGARASRPHLHQSGRDARAPWRCVHAIGPASEYCQKEEF